jgi:outer membrane protein TolC
MNCRLALLTASLLAGLSSPGAAQAVTEARVRELAALAASQTVPGTPGVPAGAPMELRLDEAVQRALERNLDIAVERINPLTVDLSIAALRGAYSPNITSTVGSNYLVQLPTSQLVGGTAVQVDTSTANVGTSWNLPWYGGSLTTTWNNRKQESTNLFTTFTPQFNTSISATYVQPLLRGLTIDLTRQQLRVTQINRDISDVQLRATITNTLANVRNAYWDLLAAQQAVEVARQSVALADKLVEDNKIRVEVGALAPIDIVQAEAEAATRRQSLAQAEATARTAELALKRLIVDGTSDPLWSAALVPVDRPGERTGPIDLLGALRKALDVRTDLQQARMQLESNDVTVKYLRNQRLPAVDLLASYGLQGIGGTRYVRSGTGGSIQEIIQGGYGDALDMIGRADYPQWTAQVNISYPLGQSSADASYARARLQLTQTQAQIKALELQVATEVTTAATQIESNTKRLEAATAARELAQKRLEAEQSKFEVGMSTNFFVVQAQRDLFDAQLTELRARLDHQKSLVDFDRLQQTSLSRPTLSTVSTGGTTGGTSRTGGSGQ